MSNDTSILGFPSRMFSSKHYDLETDRLIHDAKMAWVRPLNQAALRICTISNEGKEGLRNFNKLCQSMGYPLLISDECIDKL